VHDPAFRAELGQIVDRRTGLTGYDPQVELFLVDATARPELGVSVSVNA
jgi:hypothetical protein